MAVGEELSSRRTSRGVKTAAVYCKTLDEALREVASRRATKAPGTITRYEKSPYGGYRVYSIEAEALVDDLVDPVLPNAWHDSLRRYG